MMQGRKSVTCWKYNAAISKHSAEANNIPHARLSVDNDDSLFNKSASSFSKV
jgi:hypothetical protein